MSKKRGKSDSQIGAIINEWDDDMTDCSDEEMADKENISCEREIHALEPITPQLVNIGLKPITLNIKPSQSETLISSRDNSNCTDSKLLDRCPENVASSILDQNLSNALNTENKITSISESHNIQNSGLENTDNILETFEGEDSCSILISQCNSSDTTEPPQTQQTAIPEKKLGEFYNITTEHESQNILIPGNTSDISSNIKNLPVYAEDGLLIFSSITQSQQNNFEIVIEPERISDDIPVNSDGKNGDILINECNNSAFIDDEESSSYKLQVLQGPCGTEITKRGQIRKRKANIDQEEIKKRQLEKIAEKHKILESCEDFCKIKCKDKISEERRREINEQYWKMGWMEQRTFILNSCLRLEVQRRTTKKDPVRKNSFKYNFRDIEGKNQRVCKHFFLTTLGFKKSNDRVVHNVLSNTPKGMLQPKRDMRGRHSSANKISDVEFKEHVESFQPTNSHYRRDHAPNVRYLPSDITITIMHNDFITKYPYIKMSYETYRQKLKKINISFARLGHEECSECEAFKQHNHEKNDLKVDCDTCNTWKAHHEKYTKSRALYRKHAESATKGSKATHFSADLEKVIMLPRADTFKEVIFAKRLTVFNECFVPLGEKSTTPAFAAVWHEGIAGRCKEELISTFYEFVLSQRDSESLDIWLDNCASQNKNWCLFSFLIYIINSDVINSNTISIHYFEPGHSFMSADSFHHQIEISLKRMGKAYDFNDFTQAVQQANKSHVTVKKMSYFDFYNWVDYTSLNKLKDKNRPYLSDIVGIKATRGDYTLKYKNTYEETEEYKTLNFLKASVMKKSGMTFPKAKEGPDGFPRAKKENILHALKNILPENRKQFWRDLPEPKEEETRPKKQKKRC